MWYNARVVRRLEKTVAVQENEKQKEEGSEGGEGGESGEMGEGGRREGYEE